MIHVRSVTQDIINKDKFDLRPLVASDQAMIDLYAGD